MKTLNRIVIIGGTVAVVAMAMAAVTFDPVTAKGFVGKGDVQLTYGWNDKTFQSKAAGVTFEVNRTVSTVYTWECLNTNNGRTSEKDADSTTKSKGVYTSVGRDSKGRITGFVLNGFASGEETIINSSTAVTGVCTGQSVPVRDLDGNIIITSETTATANLFVNSEGVKYQLPYDLPL
jgi:hypothetical protein